MENPAPLAHRLAACRAQPGAWPASYDRLIMRLRLSGATAGAPVVGAVVPDFILPDAMGRLRRLGDLVAQRPCVISFNRGSWCPYCQEEVTAWAGHADDLARLGARLIIITPETGGQMKAFARMAGPRAVVLCDVDLGVALTCGLAVPIGLALMQEFRDDGLDLSAMNGTASGFLPVPATFVLDAGRQVHFAFVDPDFTRRAEPSDVLLAVSTLTGRA